MQHFFEQTPESLAEFCRHHGVPRHVGTQLLDWVYRKGVYEPAEMSNLSKAARTLVAESFLFHSADIIQHQSATDDTQKLLMSWRERQDSTSPERSGQTPGITPGSCQDSELKSENPTLDSGVAGLEIDLAADGTGISGHKKSLKVLNIRQASASMQNVGAPLDTSRQTECVMIPSEDRRTACASSQIGCPVGCRFCASGLGGLDGNLRHGQIVEQIHRLSLLPKVGRITNVVFMGMGEPLANFANVTAAIRTLNAPWGFNISARKITVSTVGLPAAIRKLMNFELPITLALSLHAPNDDLRRQLIPWAEYARIDELLDACDEYFVKTGREITLEYLLLRNVNDRPEHAHELARHVRTLRANANLIRYNEVRDLPFERPSTDDVHAFQDILRNAGVNAHIRASRGRDIAAACGQLRHEHRNLASVSAV